MSAWRLIGRASLAPEPWRNGGGTAWPVAAGQDWRLSLARIDRDGPFSAYAGIARQFALTQGAVALTIDGAVRAIGAADAPIGFSGDAGCTCALPGGEPATALNLMCTRGKVRGTLARVTIAKGEPVPVPARDEAGDETLAIACHVQSGALAIGAQVARAGDTWLRGVLPGADFGGRARRDDDRPCALDARSVVLVARVARNPAGTPT